MDSTKTIGNQPKLFGLIEGQDMRASCPNIYTVDQGIREAFERRAEYHLPDSMGYFYDHIDRISLPTYVPTQQGLVFVF